MPNIHLILSAIGLNSYASASTSTGLQWFPYWTRETGKWTLLYQVKFSEGTSEGKVTVYLNDPDDELRWIHLQKRPHGPYQVSAHVTHLRAESGKVDENRWIVEGVKKPSYRILLVLISNTEGEDILALPILTG